MYALYIPEACAIVTSVSYSPSHELQKQGVPANEIANRIPPLHQLSDILWAVWETLIYAPGNLQYYAVDGITNVRPLFRESPSLHAGTSITLA